MDALVDGSVAAPSHCIMGKTNWYIYSVFNQHFLCASFWRLCVIVSNSKDSLGLLPSPRRHSLLPDFLVLLLTSLMLWSSVSCSQRAELASQPKHFPEGRQRGRSAILGRSGGFLEEDFSSIKSKFVALKM